MNKKYIIKELSEEEFLPLLEKNKNLLSDNVHAYSTPDILNEHEEISIKELECNLGTPYKLYLGIFDEDNQFLGWTWGQQENKTTFYMVNSAVLEGHRRVGLYSSLVHKCIEIVSEKGFQLIYSRHCATNNAVIIPKLKAGFIISKMEIDDKYGVLIHLHFYINKMRRKLMDYRSGQLSPDDEIKKLFKL